MNYSVSAAIAAVSIASLAQLSSAAVLVAGDPTTGLATAGSVLFIDDASTTGGDTNAATSVATTRTFDLNQAAGAPGVAGTVKITGFGFATAGTGFANTAGVSSTMTASFLYLGANGAVGGGDDVAIGASEAYTISNGTVGDGVGFEGANQYYVNFDTAPTAVIDGLAENFQITLAMTSPTGATLRFKTTTGTAVTAAKFSFAGSFTPTVTVNQPPTVVIAPSTLTIDVSPPGLEGGSATITASDLDGTIASLIRSGALGALADNVTESGTNPSTFSLANLDYSDLGTYTFTYTATDNQGATGTGTLTVNIVPEPVTLSGLVGAGVLFARRRRQA